MFDVVADASYSQVEGKVLSISGRKKVNDMTGNHLFSIVKEHFHIHATYAAENAKGEKILEVKSSFKCTSPDRGRPGLERDYRS